MPYFVNKQYRASKEFAEEVAFTFFHFGQKLHETFHKS